MIGSLIGAGIGAVGSIFGAIRANKASKEAQKLLLSQMTGNKAWYDRRYNEDALNRAEAQRMWQAAIDHMRKTNKQAERTAEVTGASTESVAAAKAAGTNALGDQAAQIAASESARKDSVENQYRTTDQALVAQQIAAKQGQAANTGAAAQGLAQAAAGAGAAYDDYRQAGEYNKTLKSIFGLT